MSYRQPDSGVGLPGPQDTRVGDQGTSESEIRLSDNAIKTLSAYRASISPSAKLPQRAATSADPESKLLTRADAKALILQAQKESKLELDGTTSEHLVDALYTAMGSPLNGQLSEAELLRTATADPAAAKYVPKKRPTRSASGIINKALPAGCCGCAARRLAGVYEYLSDRVLGLGTTTPLMLVLWCALYVGAIVALWVTAWQDYAASGVCTQVARAAGANLNLHGALMLVTMLRKTHTALGAIPWLAVWLPLDLMNTGHKIFSCMTGVFAVIHTTAHAANWMTQAGGGHDLAMTKIFTVTRTLGLAPGWAGPTGVALWICYVILFAGWSSRISWMMFEGACCGCSPRRG